MGLTDAIIITSMILIVALNYLRFRDVLYPGFIHAVVWTGIIGLYFLHRDILIPLSPSVYLIIVGGLVLFSLGAFVATRGHVPSHQPLRGIDFEPKEWYMNLLIWLPLVGLLPFLMKTFVLGQEGPFETFYRNLRYAIADTEEVSGGGTWGVWAYLIPISFVSVSVQVLLERYKTHAAIFWLSFAAAVIYAFFATGRTFVLLLIIVFAGILLITRRISPLKTSAVVLIGGIALFLALGILVGKGGNVEYGVDVDPKNLWDIFVVYSLGSLPAFDTYLHTNIDWTWGQHVFRSFFAVLSELGFDVEVKPLVQPYSLVPFPTNVYTVYQPYLTDFGVVGLILAPFGLGYLHGVVYRKATDGHLFSIIIYAFLLYPLVFQFFQDQYFNLLSTWIQYLILLIPFFYRFRVLRPQPVVAASS